MTTNRISAFICYSSQESKIGGRFKSCLESYCGYETFIAHDDIPASSEWEREIIKAIPQADFFIPLISESFKTALFTDQETGIAVYLKKKILPIKIEAVDPYGFIGKYQALQYKKYPSNYYVPDNIKELVLTIARIGLRFPRKSLYHQKALNSVVYAFCKCYSFESANATIRTMIECKDFSAYHLKQITQAIDENDQIQGAYELTVLKEFLKKTYDLSIE